VSRGVKQSSSLRYNRAITLKKKQLGKVRTSSILAIQASSCHREELCNYFTVSVRATAPSKSRNEISVRGEGCDTSSVTVAAIVPE
jgi:hypothetical protein